MIIDRLWRSLPGKYFCLSTKSRTKKWQDHFFTKSEFNRIPEFLEEYRSHDIYFCPHGFREERRLKEYAVRPALLWADLDEADPRTIKFKPTIAIESSPGRYVGLWVTDEKMTEDINQRLTKLVGADPGGWDLTQVLRVPGTINHKYNHLPRVRTMWVDGPTYQLQDIEKKLPGSKKSEYSNSSNGDAIEVYKKYQSKIKGWLQRELLNGKPKPGKRSEMIWKLGNRLLEIGVSRDEAKILLKASPWNKFAGRASEDRQLDRELDKGLKKHLSNGHHVNGHDEDPYDNDPQDYKWLHQNLEDVEEEDIDWVWYPYLARGELTIIEGDPGLGKSYLAQMISGHIIDGKRLPRGSDIPSGSKTVKGKVVYFDIENSAGTVTKKRMIDNGFENLKDYIQEEGIFSIDDEEALDRIYEALERVKPTLVVFDTVNTYLGKADAFKGHEAQQAFVKFREIAKDFNCAVLVLRHLTKSSKERALYRGQGSIAFAGIARVVVTVGLSPEDEETRIVAITKLNIAAKPKSLDFTIEPLPNQPKAHDRSKFVWGGTNDYTADEIVSVSGKKSEKNKERDEAKGFLKSTLSGDKEIEESKVLRMAEARSISLKALKFACDEMNINKTDGIWSLH